VRLCRNEAIVVGNVVLEPEVTLVG
jgi:hypothetical protein